MNEKNYIRKRKIKATLSKIPYYIFGILPIKKNKIVIHNKCGQPVPCGKRFSLNLWKTFPDVKKRCVFHLIVL